MAWTITTGCDQGKVYVYGGSCDEKGRIITTETSVISGILTDITKVEDDKGASDIYIDKTWDSE